MQAQIHASRTFNPRESSVINAERLRLHALLSRDPLALGELLDDRISYTHQGGRLDGKRALLEGLADLPALRGLSVSHLDVRVHDDIAFLHCAAQEPEIVGGFAVVTGEYSAEFEPPVRDGKPRSQSRVTAVWRESARGWKLCAFHADA
jgi:hypothetical protein